MEHTLASGERAKEPQFEEALRCLLTRKFSASQLRQLLNLPHEIPGTAAGEIDRKRAVQIQIFRMITYSVGCLAMLFYLKYVGRLWMIPLGMAVLNTISYFLAKRTSWFRSLNALLFILDAAITEFMIWEYGAVLSHATLFLPILVIAMVFYLPKLTAIALSLLLVLVHDLLLYAQGIHLLPVGYIAQRIGILPDLFDNRLLIEGGIVFASLILPGSLIFGVRLFELLRRRELEIAHANQLIQRYLPAQLVEQLLTGKLQPHDSYERRKLTIFFSDLKGFTESADQIEPEELSRILNEYLSEMSESVEKFGGTLDKFIGDAIMVFFGAPASTSDQDHAFRAVRMAVSMQEKMQRLKKQWFAEGLTIPLEIRIGINTGMATIGNFGSEDRLDYTAIGNQVNLAARLEEHCSPGKILISHSTWALVKDVIPCKAKKTIKVKGIHYPVPVYEVIEQE